MHRVEGVFFCVCRLFLVQGMQPLPVDWTGHHCFDFFTLFLFSSGFSTFGEGLFSSGVVGYIVLQACSPHLPPYIGFNQSIIIIILLALPVLSCLALWIPCTRGWKGFHIVFSTHKENGICKYVYCTAL